MKYPRAELLRIYRKQWPALQRALARFKRRSRLSEPLLMDLEANDFLLAPVRTLFVGQETTGWEGTPGRGRDAIGGLLQSYADVMRAPYGSPLWQAMREIAATLDARHEPPRFAWSNLFKVAQNRGRPEAALQDAVLESFNVLPDEIRLINPRAIVFFTGRPLDHVVTRIFRGARFEIVSGFDATWLERVVHRNLPHETYRTYHPGYLWRKRQRPLVTKLARQLALKASF
jgi:hypothetical protein